MFFTEPLELNTVVSQTSALHTDEETPQTYTRYLQDEAAHLVAPKLVPSHEQVLARLLKQIQPVDFRALAGLTSDRDNVKTAHYVVVVIQEVLNLATRNSWNLCRRQGFLYSYNGSYWKPLDEDALQKFLGQAAEQLGVPRMQARHHAFIEQLYKQFVVTAVLPTAATTNREVVLANLRNGTFEIGFESQQLRPPAAEDFLTHELPFAYNEGATAPRWQAFLNRVVPDVASQQVLAEYLGYVFVAPAALKLEKVLLLYGTGANGKSVFFEVVTALLGPDNVSNYSLSSLTKEPAYSRAHLATKLVNYASELNGRLEADTFKQLASGEPIEARLPYGQPFSLTDYAKLIFNCNELPTEVEHTHAFFRRFLIVPFAVTIPEAEQDKSLAGDIIRDELAGVFNWILAGLRRVLAQRGFSNCAAAQEQLEAYKRQSDSVRLFLDENGYVPATTVWVPTKDVFHDYKQFCLDDGYRAVARQNFVSRLRTASIAEERKNFGKALGLRKEAAL
jgi:putative DNA primase/helicase